MGRVSRHQHSRPCPSPQALFKQGTKATKKASRSGTERQGGVGYRRYQGDALWLPNTQRPGQWDAVWELDFDEVGVPLDGSPISKQLCSIPAAIQIGSGQRSSHR
jgi:hypothetical protein